MMAAKRHDKRVGYRRVSSVDQSTERQLEGIQLDDFVNLIWPLLTVSFGPT